MGNPFFTDVAPASSAPPSSEDCRWSCPTATPPRRKPRYLSLFPEQRSRRLAHPGGPRPAPHRRAAAERRPVRPGRPGGQSGVFGVGRRRDRRPDGRGPPAGRSQRSASWAAASWCKVADRRPACGGNGRGGRPEATSPWWTRWGDRRRWPRGGPGPATPAVRPTAVVRQRPDRARRPPAALRKGWPSPRMAIVGYDDIEFAGGRGSADLGAPAERGNGRRRGRTADRGGGAARRPPSSPGPLRSGPGAPRVDQRSAGLARARPEVRSAPGRLDGPVPGFSSANRASRSSRGLPASRPQHDGDHRQRPDRGFCGLRPGAQEFLHPGEQPTPFGLIHHQQVRVGRDGGQQGIGGARLPVPELTLLRPMRETARSPPQAAAAPGTGPRPRASAAA